MKVFLSGVAGTGMSSLAGLFKQAGHQVYGSDIHFYPPVDQMLKKMNIKLFPDFDPKNIPEDVDLCVIGNVISRGNPEAEFILNNNIPYDSMAGVLRDYFIKGCRSIVVAGTHGKTTIASFVAFLLDRAGYQPGFFIGGKPIDFDRNYEMGSGHYFVIEGDEYETSFFDRSSKFLKYFPKYLILTALEYDHIDFFPDRELYVKSFQNLVNQVPSEGVIIYNSDFPMNLDAVKKSFTPLISYGSGSADFQIGSIAWHNDHYCFSLKQGSQEMKFRCSVLGRHNIWNVCAGIILGYHLDIPEQVIKKAVETFRGVDRRLKVLGNKEKTVFLEDFAHHPTSVEKLLKSIREIFPGRKIIALFEPRCWSLRRNIFQNELVRSLAHADMIGIKDVYQKEMIIPEERLDVEWLKAQLLQLGKKVRIFSEYEQMKDFLESIPTDQDQVIVLISNGDFGGIPAYIEKSVVS
jgi:UDP-N-acetylmuramate: L-alanyl-gamma-D-glutamyl-meso-diaminopimelate ligase